MTYRMKQIAAVVPDLAAAEEEIVDVLGLQVCHRDEGMVDNIGLENMVLPIGNQLLEVISPVKENTPSERYLERRGGPGGFQILLQSRDDHSIVRQRVDELGVRVINEFEREEYICMMLHPKDTGGTFLEIDEHLGDQGYDIDGPWWPAGDNWRSYRFTHRVSSVPAAEVQCNDPETVANRWSEIVQLDLDISDGVFVLPLDDSMVRFTTCQDGRPEGLGGLDVVATDSTAVLDAAEARGIRSSDKQVMVCGMRINLV